MLLEPCSSEDKPRAAAHHELAACKESLHHPEEPALNERQIVVAADAVLEDRSVLERAEKLRDALGFSLRLLPALPQDSKDPYETLRRESENAALLVVRNPPCDAQGGRDPRWHSFLRHIKRPVLAVGTCGPAKAVVAASDCSDPALPVVREARTIAAALGSKLILVHNVDPLASQFAERVGLPMSTPMADMLAHHLREQLEVAVVDSEVVITRDEDNARGILHVANAHQAELIVVGVKPQEVAPHGTADAIIDTAQQSVLFIPLVAASKSVLLD